MSVSKEIIAEICGIFIKLFGHIAFEEKPFERLPLAGGLTEGEFFGIDEPGYYGPYQDLLRVIFSIEDVGKKWSYQAITQIVFKALVQLANNKRQKDMANFDKITLDLINEIDVQFHEQEYCIPILGLSVDRIIQIGDVEFFPLIYRKELFGNSLTAHLDRLIDYRDCLASTKVNAESQKSTSIARERIEKALNILRFMGALIWWDRPIGHIYLAGKQLGRVAYTISVDPETHNISSVIGSEESTPVPFKIDDEFMKFADFHGFPYIQSIFDKPTSPIENDLLAALQWFGHATQELEPLVSFVKFYIAIETALKKENERSAKACLPERIGVLLEPWSKIRQAQIESEVRDLIDERNSVFHAGRVGKFDPEHLAVIGRDFAMDIIKQLRKRINSDKLQTKDDLINWVKAQSKELEI